MDQRKNIDTEEKGFAVQDLQAVYEVPLKLRVVLGSSELKLSQVLALSKGSVVELDKKAGDPVDLYVGDKLIARGEIVLVDNKVGMTLTEIATTKSSL